MVTCCIKTQSMCTPTAICGDWCKRFATQLSIACFPMDPPIDSPPQTAKEYDWVHRSEDTSKVLHLSSAPLHPDFSKSHGLWSSNFGWVLWHLTPKWDQPSWDPGESVMSDAIVGMQLCQVAYQQSFHAFWFQASSSNVLPHQPSTLFAQKKKHLCFRVAWKSSVSHCLHKLILQSRILLKMLAPSAENASLASSLLKLSATKPWLVAC